tara:strand:- start:2297 stop:3262 length:966 start_codon:yes stop_codon:yes gene_type:complete
MMRHLALMLACLGGLLLNGCSSDDSGRAMGTLERERLTLTAPASEIITDIRVHEGQVVRAGEVLLSLDSTHAEASVRVQQAQLDQANAYLSERTNGARQEELASAQARVEGANASLLEAQQQWQRATALRQQNLTGQADVDSATARRDSSSAALDQALQQQRELTNGTRPEQLAQARAAVATAQAQLDNARRSLQELTLQAPADSVVDILPWHRGDRISAGSILVTLLSRSTPYARVYLPQNRLTGLMPGSHVSVQIDGLAQPLDGVIRSIRSQPAFTPYYALNERDRAALMYLTDIVFEGEALQQIETLPSGRTLEVVLP